MNYSIYDVCAMHMCVWESYILLLGSYFIFVFFFFCSFVFQSFSKLICVPHKKSKHFYYSHFWEEKKKKKNKILIKKFFVRTLPAEISSRVALVYLFSMHLVAENLEICLFVSKIHMDLYGIYICTCVCMCACAVICIWCAFV